MFLNWRVTCTCILVKIDFIHQYTLGTLYGREYLLYTCTCMLVMIVHL